MKNTEFDPVERPSNAVEKSTEASEASEANEQAPLTSEPPSCAEHDNVSRETLLSAGSVRDMYALFRADGLAKHESLFNALYLYCHNRYESAPTDRKKKYKSIHEHPLGWAGDRKKLGRHNIWSFFLRVLDAAACVTHGFKRAVRACGHFVRKVNRIPHSMDNSARAIRAFFRVLRKALLPIAAVCVTLFAAFCMYRGLSADYAVDVYVDGVYVGNTLSVGDVLASKRSYEADLSARYGTPIVLDCDISFVPSLYENKEKIASDDISIYSDYMDRFVTDGYGLYVDGKLAAVTSTEKWFYDAISEYMSVWRSHYSESSASEDEESVERYIYDNNMTIIADKYPHSYFLSYTEVRELFSLPTALSDEEDAWMKKNLHFIDWELFDGQDAAAVSYSLNLNYDTLDHARTTGNGLSVYNAAAPAQSVSVALTVIKQESATETIPYEVETVEDETLAEGTRRLIRNGSVGKKTVYYNAYYQNGEVTGREVTGEEIVTRPVNKIVRVGTRELTEEEKNCQPTGTYIYPYEGKITSYFGWRVIFGSNSFHQGIDIWGQRGQPVVAADGGEVIEVGSNKSYGNYCLIRHNEEIVTRYAHCDEITVKEGDLVPQGGQVGTLGASGNATGVHVHFEIIKDGVKVDPLPYMTGSLPYVAV